MIRVARSLFIAALAGALAGCSVPHAGNSATSDISGCAVVLPLARATVHGQGTLVLVHPLGPREEGQLYRELGAPPQPTPPPGAPPPPPDTGAAAQLPKTCIIVYQGDYRPGSVDGVATTASGKYALIVLRVRHPTVYRVLLVDQLPTTLPD